MTQDEIIRMAREAGFTDIEAKALEYFYQAAFAAGVANEREACAKVCEELESAYIKENEQYGCQEDAYYHGKSIGAEDCAAAIRARSN